MENTQIIFRDDGINGEVKLFSGKKKVGKMDFSVADGTLRIYHTEVNRENQGKGLGKFLLDQVVNYARYHYLGIIPLCPYVLTQFRKDPANYEDVWLTNKEVVTEA